MISYTLRKWMFIIALISITCIAALLILQVICSSSNISTSVYDQQFHNTQSIEIMQSFHIQTEWLHLSVVILYTTGLVITSTAYIHWYFVPLAVFIGIQWIYSTFTLLDRDNYIKDQLQLSWQAAYKDNVLILENIQNQWNCQGFSTTFDEPAFTSTENVDTACYPILSETFGSTIYIWGIGLWAVKVIQIIGLMACYALYIHAHHEFKQNDEERGAIQLPEHNSDIEEYTDSDDDDDDDAATIVVLPFTHVNEKQPVQNHGEYPF
ncbi:uncharacterized protein ATC70_011316 [Mucor velutinosus]|uniref:Tetraspanin n=1 Tax=Mucor velutinosus TaxID=708070 RepID=A0AAN7DF68_9FUNG|nr:hypothetical protein ATC70_011316 [Mucor velutinosus]